MEDIYMNRKEFDINGVPTLMLGGDSENVYLFVHGQFGRKEEAEGFAEIAVPLGYQVLSIDLPEHGARTDGKKLLPWEAIPEIKGVLKYLADSGKKISLMAVSIGAWLSMTAAEDIHLEKALLISPILDMHGLILGMMAANNVTEDMLRREGEIKAADGTVLSWDYLTYAKEHPMNAGNVPVSVLYGENDAMTPRSVLDDFAGRCGASVTVMKGGEHWFHTDEQVAFMRKWQKESIGMKIYDYFDADSKKQADILAQIEKCDWAAAKTLADFLRNNKFHEILGEGRLFIMENGGKLAAFLTLTHTDSIRDDTLFPWIGFVFTVPEYRGHRYSGQLIGRACEAAAADGYNTVWLNTDHVGFYEKYGFEYIEDRIDICGENARLYRRSV